MPRKNNAPPPRRAYRSALRVHILGIIIINKRIHGYGIYKEILKNTRLIERFGKPSIGTIYRILNSLVEEGLVLKNEEKSGGRTLYYYSATRKGYEEFAGICEAFLDKIVSGTKMILHAIPSLQEAGINTEGIIERLKEIHGMIKEYLFKE